MKDLNPLTPLQLVRQLIYEPSKVTLFYHKLSKEGDKMVLINTIFSQAAYPIIFSFLFWLITHIIVFNEHISLIIPNEKPTLLSNEYLLTKRFFFLIISTIIALIFLYWVAIKTRWLSIASIGDITVGCIFYVAFDKYLTGIPDYILAILITGHIIGLAFSLDRNFNIKRINKFYWLDVIWRLFIGLVTGISIVLIFLRIVYITETNNLLNLQTGLLLKIASISFLFGLTLGLAFSISQTKNEIKAITTIIIFAGLTVNAMNQFYHIYIIYLSLIEYTFIICILNIISFSILISILSYFKRTDNKLGKINLKEKLNIALPYLFLISILVPLLVSINWSEKSILMSAIFYISIAFPIFFGAFLTYLRISYGLAHAFFVNLRVNKMTFDNNSYIIDELIFFPLKKLDSHLIKLAESFPAEAIKFIYKYEKTRPYQNKLFTQLKKKVGIEMENVDAIEKKTENNSIEKKNFTEKRNKYKKKIAKNDTETVLHELINEFKNDSDIFDQIIVLQANYRSNQTDRTLGTISNDEYKLVENQVVRSLIEIINKLGLYQEV